MTNIGREYGDDAPAVVRTQAVQGGLYRWGPPQAPGVANAALAHIKLLADAADTRPYSDRCRRKDRRVAPVAGGGAATILQ